MLKRDAIIGSYVLIEKVGSGAFGDVWRAEKKTTLDSNEFALKFFRPKDDSVDLASIGKELQVWKRLRGLPHIISVVELDQYEDFVYVVSDFADGGSLEKYLNANGDRALPEKEAVKIVGDILTGLENLHDKNIIHRDLKPDNILIMNGKHCLADFGVSREMKSQSKATGTAGTMMYMPPEAFGNVYSPQTDIWAVGVILQRLLTGRLPFPQDNQAALIGAIIQFDPEPMSELISPDLRRIVARCLHKNPNERYESAAEMKDELRTWSLGLSPKRTVNPAIVVDAKASSDDLDLREKQNAKTVSFSQATDDLDRVEPEETLKSSDKVEATELFGVGLTGKDDLKIYEAVMAEREAEEAKKPQFEAQIQVPVKKSNSTQPGFVGRYWPVIVAGVMLVSVIAGVAAWSGLSGRFTGSSNSNIVATPTPAETVTPSPSALPVATATIQTVVPTPTATPLANQDPNPVSPTLSPTPMVPKPTPVPQRTNQKGPRPANTKQNRDCVSWPECQRLMKPCCD